jgi:hypothetical protein
MSRFEQGASLPGLAPDEHRASSGNAEPHVPDVVRASSPRFVEFLTRSVYPSYERGVLRLFLPGGRPDIGSANALDGWIRDWPDAVGLWAFAYDWLGRVFLADPAGVWTEAGGVVRLVPGSGDIEVPDDPALTVDRFLFDILPSEWRDWLSADYFDDWRRSGHGLDPTQCIGYRVPLLLGGEDDLPNLEAVNLLTYLSVSGQVVAQVGGLPDGTAIDRIKGP